MLQQLKPGTTDVAQTLMVGPAYGATPRPKQNGTKNQFYTAFPYIEREFYFTTDKSRANLNTSSREWEWDFTQNRANLNIRIPDRSVKIGGLATGSLANAQTQRFIPPQLERSNLTQPVLAPILPGRYAVVGSAGTNFNAVPGDPPDANNQTYTTAIGRQESGGEGNTSDTFHEQAVKAHSTRRIEMRPGRNLAAQQLLVGSNGGDPKDQIHLGDTYDPFSPEIARDNELINDKGTIKNIQDSKPAAADGTITGLPNDRYYLPAVSIPVEGMNVSEPPWGYGPREKEAGDEEKALKIANGKGNSAPNFTFKRTFDRKEGRYFRSGGATNSVDSYDKPFDTAPELKRNGTTANYRVIHLQRLANPLLPWNPPPVLADGTTANPEHRSNLPINPYLTVDSASVNLTAFNGTSSAEDDIDISTQVAQGKVRPGNLVDITRYRDNFKNNTQVWSFRSQERGFWSRVNLVGSNPPAGTAFSTLPQRVLWAQEPANVFLKRRMLPAGQLGELLDLIDDRQMTMRYADEVPIEIKTNQNPKGEDNFSNMVLKHSLGFGNESFGLLYDKQSAVPGSPVGTYPNSTPPTASAVGVPAPGRFIFMHNVNSDGTIATDPAPVDVNSTNPWLAWGNRPYVSEQELLNVPMGSQATMLRSYSTVDPNKPPASRTNPYGLGSLGAGGTPAANAVRWAVLQSPFGSLGNVFAASVGPAGLRGERGFYRALRCAELLSHSRVCAGAFALRRHRQHAKRGNV